MLPGFDRPMDSMFSGSSMEAFATPAPAHGGYYTYMNGRPLTGEPPRHQGQLFRQPAYGMGYGFGGNRSEDFSQYGAVSPIPMHPYGYPVQYVPQPTWMSGPPGSAGTSAWLPAASPQMQSPHLPKVEETESEAGEQSEHEQLADHSLQDLKDCMMNSVHTDEFQKYLREHTRRTSADAVAVQMHAQAKVTAETGKKSGKIPVASHGRQRGSDKSPPEANYLTKLHR